MNVRLVASALALSLASSFAFAQTCASPITINSNSTVDGDTCGAANVIPSFGALPSPHNDVVYSFVAEGADATISMPASNFNYGAFLLDACDTDGNAFPTQAITNPPGGSFQVSGLVDGQTYYIVVSGSPAEGNPVCGTFTLDVDGTLPVELQSFSVD